MKCNLRTVSLLEGYNFSIFPGWYVTVSSETVFVHKLGKIPLKKANLKNPLHSPFYLLSASIITEEVEEDIPISTENEIIYQEVDHTREKVPVIKVQPELDDNFYYRFFLDDEDISFSSDFKVIKDTWTELYTFSHHHLVPTSSYLSPPKRDVRMIYASLPSDVPFIIDSNKTICISPF